jgi:hypothetical protein
MQRPKITSGDNTLNGRGFILAGSVSADFHEPLDRGRSLCELCPRTAADASTSTQGVSPAASFNVAPIAVDVTNTDAGCINADNDIND